MTFSVEVPDAFVKQLHLDGPQPDRRALELLALEGYRSGDLSRVKVGLLLGFSFYETEEFLKMHGAEIELSMEEFLESAEALEKLIRK